MNGYSYTEEQVVSEFTLAVLEDSGYYKANYYTEYQFVMLIVAILPRSPSSLCHTPFNPMYPPSVCITNPTPISKFAQRGT